MKAFKNKRLLIVDDQSVNRAILSELFDDEYRIIEAADGLEALECVEVYKTSICAILLDLMMPNMDGFEFIKVMSEKGFINKIPIIIVTSDDASTSFLKAYDYNVADIFTKPINAKVIKRRLFNIVELYEYKNHIEQRIQYQKAMILRQEEELKNSLEEIINALITVIEFKSGDSGEHCKRIRKLTKMFMLELMNTYQRYDINPDMIDAISIASSLHDIGKVAIPDNILHKPGRLTSEEFEEMKKHTSYGANMLDKIKFTTSEKFYKYCYDIVLYHHERYDGNGYPCHLKGDEIPIWSQVVSLVDVYDALTSQRVYKEAYSHDKAVEMINNGECGKFNPDLIEIFNKHNDEIRLVHEVQL